MEVVLTRCERRVNCSKVGSAGSVTIAKFQRVSYVDVDTIEFHFDNRAALENGSGLSVRHRNLFYRTD
jgi:hypothetical protein